MICLDACIIGHALAPENSKVEAAELMAAKELIDQVMGGGVTAVAPSILISEVKWFTGRFTKSKGRTDFMERADEVEDLLPQALGKALRFTDVDFAIASLAADYRLEHYSKKNPFSYNDGLYLATASIMGCDALITTDKHLLAVSDVPVFTPAGFLDSNSPK